MLSGLRVSSLSDLSVWCFGKNVSGRICVKENQILLSPHLVIGSEDFVSHSNSVNHHYAIDTQGQEWCWGYSEFGELGNSDSYHGFSGYFREFPTPVVGDHVEEYEGVDEIYEDY
jgi:alpha-tubulin suppressor-like RCC1 family protein